MGIYAGAAVMGDVGKWAKLGLVQKEKEIAVVTKVVKQNDENFFLRMSVRAEGLVLAGADFVGITIAEPFLVFGMVVETFEMVVRVLAVVLKGTKCPVCYFLAEVTYIFVLYKASPTVHFRVVVQTILHITAVGFLALAYFEV
jgi:hypothetical protein